MRSPLAYPLNRAADTDVGGAADLQTDVMRFMAILSLCLVAIFALVQSMPMAPAVPADPLGPPLVTPEPQAATALSHPEAKTTPLPEQQQVVLTRPKWTSTFEPMARPQPDPGPVAPVQAPPEATTAPPPVPIELPPVAAEQAPGFTLRFESDTALTRLVAANQVGVYAIDTSRARRMTVSNSLISFWDASMPNSFHEMEPSTVPASVIDALSRAGVDAANTRWGVTLPGKLRGQLDDLMQRHRGGALLIEAGGTIRWESGS